MSNSVELAEKVLDVLRPFASNWSGSLRRGDLVIPQGDVSRVAREIVEAIAEVLDHGAELDERTLFLALRELDRVPSVQDRATALRRRFRISPRPGRS